MKMKSLKYICLTIIFSGIMINAHTQNVVVSGKSGYTDSLSSKKYQVNDSTFLRYLPEVEILSLRVFKRKKDQKKYDRLVRNVKKVYPYAKLVAERMIQYNDVIQNSSRKERKELVKSFENEINDKYGAELKRLTPGQGRILLKLIDRQTTHTPHEIIKELRGSIEAFFWNATAALFDFDLKKEFDPAMEEEDLYIDEICLMIDRGQL